MDRLDNAEIVAWVSAEILPLEAELRDWLRRSCRNDTGDVDDIIHDIYGRLLTLPSVDHITRPRAYVYKTARHILIDRIRHSKIVQFGSVQNIEDLAVWDATPSPERAALARIELSWVIGLIAKLPQRCKKVFELRKVYGLSQAETARNLSLSENIVEKETARGLSLISDMVSRYGRTKPLTPQASTPKTKAHALHVKS
jgi:RNA polymerase sigma factor (sigma-70 family)